MQKRTFRTPLGCFVLAVLFMVFRWIQTIDAIPAERMRFTVLHDVVWNSETNILTRTGNDPYLVVDLTGVKLPLRQVSFVFIGGYTETEGVFYMLGVSPRTQDQWPPAKTANISRDGGGFTATARLDDAATLRLDLPDFLPRPIELRRMIVHVPYLDLDSWPLRLALISSAAAVTTATRAVRKWRRDRTLATEVP